MEISRRDLRTRLRQPAADLERGLQFGAGQAGEPPPPWGIVPLDPEPPPEAPFAPPNIQAANEALVRFCTERRCSAVRRADSGLPACIFGPLQEPQDEPGPEAAEAFLRENELMMSGLFEGTRLSLAGESRWVDGAYQALYEQTNVVGVPLYGSATVCSFTPRQLTLATSTLYPALPDEIDGLEWPETWRDWDKQLRETPLGASSPALRTDPELW